MTYTVIYEKVRLPGGRTSPTFLVSSRWVTRARKSND